MTAGLYNFLIEQGSTFDKTLTVYVDSDMSTPLDLTGYSGELVVKDSRPGTTTYLTFSTADSSMVLGGAAGTVRLLATDEVTALLDFDRGVYDLELEDSGGAVTRLLQGYFTLSKQV